MNHLHSVCHDSCVSSVNHYHVFLTASSHVCVRSIPSSTLLHDIPVTLGLNENCVAQKGARIIS